MTLAVRFPGRWPANAPRAAALLSCLVVAALTGCATVPPGAPAAAPAPVAAASAPAAAASAAAQDAAARLAAQEAAERAAAQAALQRRFDDWIASVRADAVAAGIDTATLDAVLPGVHYRPRVVDRDRNQPEFSRPIWGYLDVAVSDRRVAQGLAKMQDVRVDADAASARYGVPPSVLVAIWGMESNYGADFGDIPTLDALATLGVDGRREAWARRQFIDALRILQQGDIDAAHMVGSWAGAMGQTQFMPSVFLADAVDGDGDGRRDIWGSMADVMFSTANFLARAGWRADEPWGLEVRLPAGFDAGRADPRLRQDAAAWAAEGVSAVDGGALPAMADASVMLPAGVRGPAFLVGTNYRAILRYNNAMSYALGVGLLSQRLAGGPGVQSPWPRELVTLTRPQVQSLQEALNAKGFDCGTPDGLLGPATRDALRRYQRGAGLAPDGFPTLDLLQRLQGPAQGPSQGASDAPSPASPPVPAAAPGAASAPMPGATPASAPASSPVPAPASAPASAAGAAAAG